MFAAQASPNSRACQGRKFFEQPRSHQRSSDVASASIFTSTDIQCLVKNQLETNHLVQFIHGANLLCLDDSRERMPAIERFNRLRAQKHETTNALKATPFFGTHDFRHATHDLTHACVDINVDSNRDARQRQDLNIPVSKHRATRPRAGTRGIGGRCGTHTGQHRENSSTGNFEIYRVWHRAPPHTPARNIPLYSAHMTAAKHTAILGMRDSGKTHRYTRHAWQRQSIPLYTARMTAAKQPLYTHTAIRQMPAAYTPLFNKCQRHTHRYSTNVSGIHRYSTRVI